MKLNIKKNIDINNLWRFGSMFSSVLNRDEMEAGKRIMEGLVAKFENEKEHYTSKSFKEEQTKIELINPMFEALGWDVHNKQDFSLSFREVIFEEPLASGKETRAPDYSFRLGGQLIYYLEAKKPSVNIKEDRSPAFQARRYGWSAKIPIVLLTDFEELAIYETTSKPKETERASTNRVLYYSYEDYLDKWEEIYSIFSKEAVQKGLFQKFVDDNTSKTKRGTQSIDVEFLKDIERWRLLLARNIALRNKELTLSELNLAVQLIIDRIVFFRMAEDRGIERYQTLYKLAQSEDIYQHLCEVFKKADLKYNSGLFHFSYTPDYSEFVDNITLQLNIDDGVFKEIFADLYYPKSPYEFSVISPEILGNIYENFLGSIIRLTPSHQAKIEQKPEVKKAGGVYYTPQYIVDYIVENTVGELIKGKTPNQITPLRIVDPSCGSGSFLLRAYQKLLDYHLEYYLKLKKPPKEVYYIGKDSIPRLTIKEKKRILTNNIYGVDIDVNAVEVTKLSLLLKVLEDENKDVLEQQQKLYQEKVLPNLSYNIKCGNSLISTDILNQEDLTHDEVLELNPFNWEMEFPLVFANNGFDCVIGNPPYFNIQTLGAKSKYVNYLKNNYEVYMDKTDILFYFIEKANNISKGKTGFIISNAFLFSNKGKKLRNFILDKLPLVKIVNFEKFLVFKAGITTAITFFDKAKDYSSTSVLTIPKKDLSITEVNKIINNEDLFFNVGFEKDNEFALIGDEIKSFNAKIDGNHEKLGDICILGKGMETAADKVFSFKEYPDQFSDEFIKLRVTGKNSGRYFINDNTDFILYFEFIDEFKDLPTEIKSYLKSNKKTLSNRADKKRRKTAKWWNYTFSLHKEYYDLPKLFCSRRNSINEFSYDDGFKYLSFSNMTVIFDTNENYDLKYILALLNSKLLSFRYRSIGKQTGNGIYEYFPNGVSKLPIPKISLDEQKPFVTLVDKILELFKQLESVNTPQEEKLVKMQIENVDNQIDARVYELYGLNEDEIKIVEDFISV